MKVTEIEVDDITAESCDWIAYQLNHYYGPRAEPFTPCNTDDGRVGLGTMRRDSQETIDRYMGTNPFDR